MTDGPTTTDATSTPTAGAASDFVVRFEAFWAGPDPDALGGLLHPNAHLKQPLRPEMHSSAAYAEELTRLLRLCPDLAGHLLWWAEVHDGVVIEHTLSGTIAGKRFDLQVLDRITLRDGKVVERIAYFDPSPLILTIATRPTVWLPYLRMQLGRRSAG
ncbi:nuclear transport factor 2 family protein [Nocardia suismassiliense]|uniref:Nuclear transport factor 2 family protein n=1 Tax=Nocardia suismassiliense TaxID=2077092 RepID=A0ABW6R6B9_9NOCA